MLTILDGSTFVVSDDIGDVGAGCRGRVRRRHPDALALPAAARRREPAAPDLSRRRLLQRDPLPAQRADTHASPQTRSRSVVSASSARRVTEHLTLSNESMSELSFAVELELAADFADIISVKAHDFAFGDPESAAPLPAERACSSLEGCDLRDRGRRGLPNDDSLLPGARAHAGRRPLLRLAPGACQVGADLRRPLRPGRRVGASVARAGHSAPSCEHVRESLSGVEAAGAAARDARTRTPACLRALDRRPRVAPAEGDRGDRTSSRPQACPGS